MGSATEIVPFEPAHVPGAARIAAARTARLRAVSWDVPPDWATAALWQPVLAELAAAGVGRAALVEGRVTGVLAGWPVRGGEPRVYCPEGAAGTDPALPDRAARRTLQALFEAAERDWAAAGLRTHLVSALPGDAVLLDALAWLGFGIAVVDALAPIAPARSAAPPTVSVRRATPADATEVARLETALGLHLRDSPTFLAPHRAPDAAEIAVDLADARFATFVAEAPGAGIVAYLRVGETADDTARIVRDPGTLSVSRAFTVPEHRGGGAAGALLGAAARWAGERGAVRLGVDFESANILAERFWRAHFEPVVLTHLRRLPPV